MKAFISYSSLDATIANEIVEALEKNEVECFIAPRDIRTGHVYAEEIVFGLDTSQVVVLVLTENSNNSQHVLREIERAVSNNIPIISYRNEEIKLIPAMEYFLMSTQWLDNPWTGKHTELIEAVKELGETQITGGQKAEIKSDASKNHAAVSKLKQKKNKWKIIAVIAIALWLVTMGVGLYLRTQDRLVADNESGENGDFVSTEKTVELSVGDIYTYGSYNGEQIAWWVVDIEDGIATLLTRDVITMKGFEGAESGTKSTTNSGETKYITVECTPSEQVEAFGSSDWETSSLRTWLNSDKLNVTYIGQLPIADAMFNGDNEYYREAGFLYGFSEEEREALVLTKVSTEFRDWKTESYSVKVTEDYVFIPCKDDVDDFKNLKINIYCDPTAAAIEKNNSGLYGASIDCNVTSIPWWLRDQYEDNYFMLYYVTAEYEDTMYKSVAAATGGMGVRPMLRVDISKLPINE